MKYFLIYFFIISCIFSSIAEIKLPAVFSDGMVFSENKPVHIWGTGRSKCKNFGAFCWNAQNRYVMRMGTFVIQLKSMSASSKPRTILHQAGS